jgi:hypothetical protein
MSQRLSAQDIALILDKLKDSGVKNFKFGPLSVEFWGLGQPEPVPIHVPRALEERQHQFSKEAIEQEELDRKEDTLRELLIDDPSAYEALMMRDDVDATPRMGDLGAETNRSGPE